MFKQILIPTDGSTTANKAVKAGMKFARELGAGVTGYFALESVQPQIYGEGFILDARVYSDLEKRAKQMGDTYIAAMAKAAAAEGVAFKGVVAKASTPYEGSLPRRARTNVTPSSCRHMVDGGWPDYCWAV